MSTGRRGPAPQPAAVKKQKGNPGKREGDKALDARVKEEAGAGLPTGASSPAALSDGVGGGGDSVALAAPSWLNSEGLEVWNKLAPKLATMRILGNLDLDAFGRYCQNFGRWVKLQERLDKEGETYTSESPHGTYHRAHPVFMVADRLDRALERAEANFALNPADRQRLFAARAAAGATGGAGDLFGTATGAASRDGGEDQPAPGAERRPVGFLAKHLN